MFNNTFDDSNKIEHQSTRHKKQSQPSTIYPWSHTNFPNLYCKYLKWHLYWVLLYISLLVKMPFCVLFTTNLPRSITFPPILDPKYPHFSHVSEVQRLHSRHWGARLNNYHHAPKSNSRTPPPRQIFAQPAPRCSHADSSPLAKC